MERGVYTKMKRKFAIAFLLCMMACASALAVCDGEHPFGPYVVHRNPSCRDVGLEIKYCTACDHWEKRYTPKLDHVPGEWTVEEEPTCEYRGSKTTECETCGHTMRRFIEKLPHNYGDVVVTKEPTCTANGKGTVTCADCSATEYKTVKKLGHDWQITSTTKEPTCHAAGKGVETCQRCGKTQKGTLKQLEHVFGEWEIVKEPSGKTKGTRKAVCTLCGDEDTERFFWEGTLYQDMKPNEDVIRLQEMLRDLGYYNGAIRTGTFGAITGKGVAKFQKANGLEATEVADPETRALLESLWEKEFGTAQ